MISKDIVQVLMVNNRSKTAIHSKSLTIWDHNKCFGLAAVKYAALFMVRSLEVLIDVLSFQFYDTHPLIIVSSAVS